MPLHTPRSEPSFAHGSACGAGCMVPPSGSLCACASAEARGSAEAALGIPSVQIVNVEAAGNEGGPAVAAGQPACQEAVARVTQGGAQGFGAGELLPPLRWKLGGFLE